MATEQQTQAQEHDDTPICRLRVVVLEGADAGEAYEPDTGQTISVGSSRDNDVVLNDPAVSRYHIELRQGEKGIEALDLGSLNGTFLAGVRLLRAILPPGTRLRLGSTVIGVQDGAPARAQADEGRPSVAGLVGRSGAIQELHATIHGLASSPVSVLIEGETGTGKEVVARAIHGTGTRDKQPFVVVDCGSLPPTLIASELFGHEQGAFTGADRQHVGAFERAHGGTLFLDEVGELPLQIQPVLLGALERRRFRRVGGSEEIAVDVRVIAATHRDLRAEVNAGTFRPDLYYRLAVTRVVIPPLRERPEDIEPLVAHFVEQITGDRSRSPLGQATVTEMRTQRWTGNVRELRNVVEAALAMGHSELGRTREVERTSPDALAPYGDARAEALADFEREYLAGLIARCKENASQAARLAQMDRSYLLSLLKRHGLR